MRQGKVTGHGIPAAPQGGPRVPGGDPDQMVTVDQARDAAGQLDGWVDPPLGVESRPPRMRTFHYERPWEGIGALRNDGSHGVILPPNTPPIEGEQQPQMVYPAAPMVRRPPGSWAEPLMREGGPAGAAAMPRPGEA